jgi:hypothetical protein
MNDEKIAHIEAAFREVNEAIAEKFRPAVARIVRRLNPRARPS